MKLVAAEFTQGMGDGAKYDLLFRMDGIEIDSNSAQILPSDGVVAALIREGGEVYCIFGSLASSYHPVFTFCLTVHDATSAI